MKLTMPADRTPDRPPPTDHDELYLYVRSYLFIRLVIGIIGVLMPVALVAGELLFLERDSFRGSLSDYYHSGMRDVFVASLCVIGLFLITYMLFLWNWDNVLSVVAGLAAVGVAMFPTGGGDPLTPLQDRLGESLVGGLHFFSAAVFILLLGVMSFRFGTREGAREDRPAAKRWRWKAFHRGCAFAIFGAVAYIAATKITGVLDEFSLLLGETIAAVAFGASWFFKGAEWDLLLNHTHPAPPVPEVI